MGSAPFTSPLAERLAPDVLERFLRYVRYDTQSAYDSETFPSTLKQLELSRLLADELRGLGLEDVELDDNGYVFATLPGQEGAPVVGLIAHVDTAPDAPGAGVEPRIHEDYAGGDIVLEDGVVLSPEESPQLAAKHGHDIVTSDGRTLLGADNKAGVAEIMAAVAHLAREGDRRHATVRVGFTVDEEIGAGADRFDVERFGADFAYTLDGSELGELELETFNAVRVRVFVRGVSQHPGTAKGKLVNAIKLAADLVAALPRDRLSPETTEEREGFVHPTEIAGIAEEVELRLIIRDHDWAKLEEHVAFVRGLVDEAQAREPRASFEVVVEEQYRNMREVLDRHPEIVAAAEEAIRRAGAEPKQALIRGGTDGARLSFMGLPTPNVFTGGYDYHSRREWASVQDMAAAAATAVELARLLAEPAK